MNTTRRRLMAWLGGLIPAVGLGSAASASIARMAPVAKWAPDDLAERHAAAREYTAAYRAAWPRISKVRSEFTHAHLHQWPDEQLDFELKQLLASMKPTTDLWLNDDDAVAVCAVSGAPIWANEEVLHSYWPTDEIILRQAVGLPLNRIDSPNAEANFASMMSAA